MCNAVPKARDVLDGAVLDGDVLDGDVLNDVTPLRHNRTMADLTDHILHVTGGEDWWIEHPSDCLVSTLSWRELERLDETPCEFVEVHSLEATVVGWPLTPGRYTLTSDVHVEYEGPDDYSVVGWFDAVRLPDLVKNETPFAPEAKRVSYGGNLLRSLGELKIAVLLDVLGVRWKYEHQLYQLPNGTLYLPDFHLDDSRFAAVIEVKSEKRTRDLAVALGMPAVSSGLLGPTDRFTVGPVPFNRDQLPVDLLKPALLASVINDDVWVVGGRPRSNQPYVAFHPDGRASMSRQCPLYADHGALDETARIVAGLTKNGSEPSRLIHQPD